MADDEWLRDPLPIRRVQKASDATADDWAAKLAPVQQLLRDGLALGRATILIGENGTGKSTLVEAIAMAYGLNAEGGSTGAQHRTTASESSLHQALRIERGVGASRWGYFLRAETMHGLFTYLDESRKESPRTEDPFFHALSHGQSFVSLLSTKRFDGHGLFVMDEPEAGLSFSSQLALLGVLADFSRRGGVQLLVATHSPIVAALPGATILELDDTGYHPVAWDDLAMVDHHRRFLSAPERYLRHVVEPWEDDAP